MQNDWQIASAFVTHEGAVRDHNEDAYCARDAAGPDNSLWAVADGMGGHAAGDVASRMIVDGLRQLTPGASPDGFAAGVIASLERTNAALVSLAKSRNGGIIGSTVVALARTRDRVRIIWAGDSRAYRLRGGRMERLTTDHTRVAELVAQGALTEEQARTHAQSNIVTRALGAAPQIQLETRQEALRDGDLYLLCSDGLSAMASDAEIEAILPRGAPNEIASALVHMCLGRGARDNVTVGAIAFRAGQGG